MNGGPLAQQQEKRMTEKSDENMNQGENENSFHSPGRHEGEGKVKGL